MQIETANANQSGMCVITVCVDPASADKVRQATLREYCNFVGELQDYSPREGELQPLLKVQNAEASVCVIDFDQDHERAVQTANSLQQMLHGKTTLIALSEKNEPALILEAMRAGCGEYLTKPLSIETLCESFTRLRGRLARWCVNMSSTARRLAASISRDTGMYLVLPEEVPEVTAR